MLVDGGIRSVYLVGGSESGMIGSSPCCDWVKAIFEVVINEAGFERGSGDGTKAQDEEHGTQYH